MGLTSFFNRKEKGLPEELDLGSELFFQNPYPLYQLLRQHKPVAAVKPAGHILTRHRDILEALSSPSLRNAPSRFSALNSRNSDRYEASRLANNILPFLDAPKNQIRRQCLIRAVREHLSEWQPLLDETAASQMKVYLAGNNQDLISGFSSPLSLKLMCDFIGLSKTDRIRYKDLSEAFFYLFAPLSDTQKFEQVNLTLRHFQTELSSLVAERAKRPGTDLISKLILAEEDGQKLTTQEVIDSCILIFADGVENVEAGVANVLAAYHQDAQAQEMFAAGDLSIEQLVSEGLRLQTPAQFVPRIANNDIEICGIHISAETPVFLGLASGNRDQEVFENADKIRPGRAIQDYLTFGRGAHSCIGSRLAGLQICAAVKQVLDADLKPLLPLDQINFQPRLAHRWPESYPVKRASG